MELQNNKDFLTSFSRAKDRMVAINDLYYGLDWVNRLERYCNYTLEEIQNIITQGTLRERQNLSRAFFARDGYYKQIIIYYATLLKFSGLLIPSPSNGKTLSTSGASKRYYGALDVVEKMALPVWLTRAAQKALVDGCYYALRVDTGKNDFAVIDLPIQYCRTRAKDMEGNDIVEFDLSYFNTVKNLADRQASLDSYPKFITKAYKKYISKDGVSSWYILPTEYAICLYFFDCVPMLLNVIPATIIYDEAMKNQHDKDADGIRKIIVQQIPHLQDGRLLFEPDEAEEIHAGTVEMLKGDKNISVLTTYGEVNAITSNSSVDQVANVLKKTEQNIYAQAGVSSQIFTADTSGSVGYSLKNDIALMMYFANKAALIVSKILDEKFGNSALHLKYSMLPISYFNESDYVDSTFKLAGSGYSFLLPAIGSGLSQRDIVNVKDLENDILKLADKLRPLSSSYTQSGNKEVEEEIDVKEEDAKPQANIAQTEGGRPTIKQEQKTDETVRVQESK